MLLVSEIWEDAKVAFGHCNETRLFNQITDAVELLANKGEIDVLVGYVDLCVTAQCITLPREVETVLAVNIGGHPALGHDELFSFHLNGPGDFSKSCNYDWFNTGSFPTYRDLPCPRISSLSSGAVPTGDDVEKLREGLAYRPCPALRAI